MIKDDEDQSKKKKEKFESKVLTSKKRKESIPEQKSIDEKEKTFLTIEYLWIISQDLEIARLV